MTTATFNLRAPHTVDRQVTLKLKNPEGGDGYTQSVPDGINFVRPTYQVGWKNLTQTEYNAIVNFLIANAGKSFFFNVPNATSGNPQRVRCDNWAESQPQTLYYDLSAEFKRVWV